VIRALTPAGRRDWLRLARTQNVGPVTFQQLVGRYGEASIALAALPDLARRGGRVTPLDIPSIAQIEAELAAGAALGARLIAACEADFPAPLAALDPPPPVIWTRGDPRLLSRPAVAIVGARVASAGGQRFARGLAADLGAAGLMVVSGMARGVDGAAHEGALATGTVAVLGAASTTSTLANTPISMPASSRRAASSARARRDARPRPRTSPAATASSRACPRPWWWLRPNCAPALSSPPASPPNRAARSWPCRARRSTRAPGGPTT